MLPSAACLLNMSSIALVERMASLNLGDERPVSIKDCRKYGRLLGCLLWYEYVVHSNQDVNTYTLNGLLIGGSSRLHTTPWMRRTTSSISESSVSWTPSFQHRLPPTSIGLQSSLMLSGFLYYSIKKKNWMFNSEVCWPSESCAVASHIVSWNSECWSIPQVGHLGCVE